MLVVISFVGCRGLRVIAFVPQTFVYDFDGDGRGGSCADGSANFRAWYRYLLRVGDDYSDVRFLVQVFCFETERRDSDF